MKKQGFTIVDSLISMLIISVIGIGVTFVLNSYYKTTYSRDIGTLETINAVSTLEQLKSDVKSLDDLYNFTHSHSNLKMVAVGIGEVTLTKSADGKVNIIKSGPSESYVFNEKLKPKIAQIFRVTAIGKQPNTSLTTIINIRE